MLVKLDHLPRDRGEKKKIFETTSQVDFFGWNVNRQLVKSQNFQPKKKETLPGLDR